MRYRLEQLTVGQECDHATRGIVTVDRLLAKAVDVRDIHGRVERLHARMGSVDLHPLTDAARAAHTRRARMQEVGRRLPLLRYGWGPEGVPTWAGKRVPLETLEEVVRLLDSATAEVGP